MEPDKVTKHGTRTERQRARTRRQLLDAGRSLIATKGVAGLRIQEITEHADVALGSFYNYFSSKEELLEAVVAESLTDLAATIITNVSEDADPAEAASTSYRRFLRFSSDEPELARVLVELDRMNAIFEDAVAPWAKETLSRGRNAGRFDLDNIDLALTSIAGAALAAIRAILAGRIPPGPQTESRGAAMMLLGFGVDADAAREIAYRTMP